MVNGIKALASFSGLSETECSRLARQAKENVARLNSCASHEFEAIPPAQPLRTRYRCSACGGEVDFHAYHWYQRGREHAQGNGGK